MEEIKPKFIIVSLLAGIIIFFLPTGLGLQPQMMLGVMVFVVMLWITEAAPLHATAVLAGLLLILIVGVDSKMVFAQYFDPVVVLLFGGFVIAVGMRVHGLDEYIANHVISRAGNRPAWVLLALIGVSTFISMWISNSATAAIIMPIALVVLAKNRLRPGSNFGKAAVLAVAFGATIGGIGTIVGSTPNVIAAKFINNSGGSFGFYEWLWRGLPFTIILMFGAWVVLLTVFRPEKDSILTMKKTGKMNKGQKGVLGVFIFTVLLWVTEPIHGVNSSVVAFVPIVLLYFSGLLKTKHFKEVDWATLILIGGGIALGTGIHMTGLDASFAGLLANAVQGQGLFQLFLIMGIFGVIMTVAISNTTAAAVYVPIVVALATTLGADPTNVVVVASIGVSLDFIFPFGTPPTTIAWGTKYVRARDIAKAGILISIIGALLLAGMAMLW